MKTLILGIATLAVVSSISLSPTLGFAAVRKVINVEGTVGTMAGMKCTKAQCNNGNGCSWASNQYTWWENTTGCETDNSPGGQNSTCEQVIKKCREDKTYSNSNCTGTVLSWTETWTSAC